MSETETNGTTTELEQSEFQNMTHGDFRGNCPTQEQLDHTAQMLEQFKELFEAKQVIGQIEHGGNIWTKPMVGNAILEASDIVSYLFTLQRQLGYLHDIAVDAIDVLQSLGKEDVADQLRTVIDTLCHRRVAQPSYIPSPESAKDVRSWAEEVVCSYSTD